MVNLQAYPWRASPTVDDFTKAEIALLGGIYTGAYGDPGIIYSSPGRRTPNQKTLRALDSLSVIDFYDADQGGWSRGMWGARLTCLGANVAFRAAANAHLGCGGTWQPDGSCDHCRQLRPLDDAAYADYLLALQPDDRDWQSKGPQLYCTEHGWMRRSNVTTTKTCHQQGTPFHEGGLYRA